MNDRPPHVNASTWVEPLVTLRNGDQVGSTDERWRFECQARTILNMASKHLRKVVLAKWEERHGRPSAYALETEILALWKARQPTLGGTQHDQGAS